ncbi:MAG: hypothetical protein M1812_001533 [Candelaria pacifica]|nr:MAG: hypothetical protein M1812_001533 [Candelaria pacifica]
MAKNAFPRFRDGDVQIRLSNEDENVLVLHSFVLGLHSTFFKASLSERWTNSEELISGSSKIKWRYELRFEKGNADGILVRQVSPHWVCESGCGIHMLTMNLPQPVHSSVSSSTTVLHPNTESSASRSGKRRKAPATPTSEQRYNIIVAHEQLFGSLYHLPPSLPMTSFADASPLIDTLLATADMYNCTSPVAMQIERHLHRFSSEVFAACASDFFKMISLSMKLKSGWMFKKSMGHLIASHEMKNLVYRTRFESLGIRGLIDAKHAAFVSLLRDTELRLFLEVNAESSDDFCDVPIVSYFRNRLSRKINEGQGSGLADGYAKLYRCMGLLVNRHEEETEEFIQNCIPLYQSPCSTSKEASRRHFERRIKHYSKVAETIVQPLLEEKAAGLMDLGYENYMDMVSRPLSCVEITDADLPWKDKA